MDISALQRRLAPLLRPAAAVYGTAMRIRAGRYGEDSACSYRAACPVVSVGNISWGGTGKTPVVDYLLRKTQEAGIRTVVLTRGYKANPPEFPFPVTPDADPALAGDEPLLLARRHPEALVLVDPKRSRAASWAEANADPDLFLLDDGMQHLALARDLDIVLLKPHDLLTGWNRVIPAGEWREDKTALARADAFCLKADDNKQAALVMAAQTRLGALQRPFFFFDLVPENLTRLVAEGEAETVPDLGGEAYTLLCGTGNPAHVQRTVSDLLGKKPAHSRILPDHHRYTEADILAVRKNGLPVVCTAKDAVKLAPLLPAFSGLPVWILHVQAAFSRTLFSDLPFDRWWDAQMERLHDPRTQG